MGYKFLEQLQEFPYINNIKLKKLFDWFLVTSQYESYKRLKNYMQFWIK